jgi:acetyl esterase/lipase
MTSATEPLFVDAEVVPFVEASAGFGCSAETLASMRTATVESFAAMPLSADVERTDHVVSDDPRVVVRVHRPKGVEGALPCLYGIHGGGYVSGSIVMEGPRLDAWCPGVPCVGVAVEYRLAPETPYPGPLDDCYAGLLWTFEHAEALGIDPGRIGVGGASAGGGLAAALALLARDRGEVSLAFQLLECPMLDDRQVTPSSRLDGLPLWSRESNEFGWRSYLGERYGNDVPSHAAPARELDLAGLPPALVIVGGADGFRDEDVDYALRLNQAGVAAELHVLPGAPHGIQFFPGLTLAARWNAIVDDWLARHLTR